MKKSIMLMLCMLLLVGMSGVSIAQTTTGKGIVDPSGDAAGPVDLIGAAAEMYERSKQSGVGTETLLKLTYTVAGGSPLPAVLIFEADGNWNLAGREKLLKTRYYEDGYITLFFANGKTADYWFYKSAIRKFNPEGTQMYYEEPRWNP